MSIPETRMAAAAPIAYDDGYSDWKGWTEQGFGVLSDEQRLVFERDFGALPAVPIRTVLEVGYGNGAFLAHARGRGWQVTGTEANPDLVDAARQHGFDAHGADETARLPDGEFDLIVAYDVFEHVELAQLPGFLALLRRKLSPTGRIMARFPNGDSPFGRPFQHGDLTHLTTIGEHRVVQLCRLSDLHLERIRGAARRPLGRNWRDVAAGFALRALEGVVEPLLMRALFPGCRFSLFAPNTLVVLRHAD